MKHAKILLSLFALASSLPELNAYTLFYAKPQGNIGVLWVKKDRGIQYALLIQVQEQGVQRGQADIYSSAPLEGKLPHSVKMLAQDSGLTIYERHVSAWYKPHYRRWSYAWVRMDALKKAIKTAQQTNEFSGVTIKTREHEEDDANNEVALDPVFVRTMATASA